MRRRFTTEQTREFLNRLKNHQYRLDYEDLVIALDEQINRMPIVVTKFDRIPQFKEGGLYRDRSILYRARVNKNKFKHGGSMIAPWESIDDISIIPECKRHLIGRGRINKPKQSIFYCSNDYHIACYEAISKGFPLLSRETSCFLTVSEWKIDKPLNLARLYYSEDGLNFFKKHNEKLYAEKLQYREEDRSEIIDLLKEETENLTMDILLLDFFSNEIGKIEITGDFDYKLCNYYAEHVFERTNSTGVDDSIDGILYPSVPFSYQGKNIALTLKGIGKLKFLNVMYVWVTYDKHSGSMQFIPLEQSVSSDDRGKFKWTRFKNE